MARRTRQANSGLPLGMSPVFHITSIHSNYGPDLRFYNSKFEMNCRREDEAEVSLIKGSMQPSACIDPRRCYGALQRYSLITIGVVFNITSNQWTKDLIDLR